MSRILVVEDDPAILRGLSDNLKLESYEVVTAADGEAGLEKALDFFGEVPLIIRSSSLLEDRIGHAFSGKYKSLFLGNQGTKQERLAALLDAITEVYASLFGPDPIAYRREKGLIDFHEEMAVLVQEVVGKRIGAYTIDSKIAEGGMGMVFMASRSDEAFQQRVAIKLLRHLASGSKAERRFLFEREVLGKLRHPSTLYDLESLL